MSTEVNKLLEVLLVGRKKCAPGLVIFVSASQPAREEKAPATGRQNDRLFWHCWSFSIFDDVAVTDIKYALINS
jgi:hypothetical protein